MDARSIQSEINKVKSEMLQLSDRLYFSLEQEEKRKPALQDKLAILEGQLGTIINSEN